MSTPKSITALIADDEPLLRAQLRARLTALWPELEIVYEAINGQEVIDYFHAINEPPQIAFLDIHMPSVNGLQAAKAIAKRSHIVFVTAYDEYAIAAFEQGAIDYVLKPVQADRLMQTVSRLQDRLTALPTNVSNPIDLEAVLAKLALQLSPPTPNYLQWIKASVGPSVRLIAVTDVLYFQSDEKYTRVVTMDSEVLIRKTIKELLDELDPNQFWQIHRATLVNTQHIAGVERGPRDQADLKLKSRPETLTVSRNYTHLFKQM